MKSVRNCPASFGDLLKAYRKDAQQTQRQLAAKLDLHYNTIWAWERGDHLPETRGLVLEIARQLRLDEEKTRQLLEASLTAVSMYWQVPLRRNAFFTGRRVTLRYIHTYLSEEHGAMSTRSLALCGLGGIGKTQIALEYAYQYAQEFSAVFWITAETPERIFASFTSIAAQLQLLEVVPSDQYTLVAAVLSWLTTHRNWLLIVDNVDDIAVVKPFLPAARHGALLFTTRLQAFGALAFSLRLEPLQVEEGARFLLYRAGCLAPDAPFEQATPLDIRLARAITEALYGFPLALDQAGAYIEEVQCTLEEYLQLYQASPLFLLDQRATYAEHPESVVRTCLLTFDQVQQRSPAALDLLRLCAFLHADAIPDEVFSCEVEDSGPPVAVLRRDRVAWDQAIKTLRSFSLIERSVETRTFALHRLVQIVIKESMAEELQSLWAYRAVRIVNQLVPEGDTWNPMTHARWQRCFSHTFACAALIEKWHMVDAIAIRLLYQTGTYLLECAMYPEAEYIYRQVLEICQQVLGADHWQIGEILNDLALLSWCQGRYGEAEPLYQQALAICERASGAEHAQVLHVRHNLGSLYHEQGKYALAEQIFQETALLREKELGPTHLAVAESLQCLALTYLCQQRYREAEVLSQRALSIRRQALGDEHPSVAHSLVHLGKIFAARDELQQGRALLLQALGIREKRLGLVHPKVAICLNALGEIALAQGEYEEAASLLQRAWEIREQMLPPVHSHRAETLYSLARLSIAQGAFERAKPLLQQARAIAQPSLEPEHPLLLGILHELSIL